MRIIYTPKKILCVMQTLKKNSKDRLILCLIFIMPLSLALLFISYFYSSVTMAEEMSVLKGMIMDIREEPVEGAEVFIYNSQDVRRPADFISSKTDKSGNFQMELPPGRYWAVARVRSGEEYGPLVPGDKHSGDPEEIELAPGEELKYDFIVVDIRETARLKRKTREDYIKIKGRVMDKNKIPLAGIYIIANRDKKHSGIPEYISAWTDDTGYYTLYIPRGKYYIGYARSFPPDKDYRIYSEAVLDADEVDFDIIIDKGE